MKLFMQCVYSVVLVRHQIFIAVLLNISLF